MRNLVFLLEEPSAKEMLKGVLPRLLPENVNLTYIVFEGKQDLEKQIERRLRGWRTPNSHFVVMRDQDSGNCSEIKANLYEKCKKANRPDTLIRIACRELESFYLGDLFAVEKGLELYGLSNKQPLQKKYRNPDILNNPSAELMTLTNKKYQKLLGSRAIGQYLALDHSNHSKSFNQLINGIKRLLES